MPEQLGHLLDHDGQHQRLEVGAGLAAVLDRPAEQHQPGRLGPAAAHQRRERHGARRPVVGDLRACPRRRTRPARAGRTTGASTSVTMSRTSSSNRSRGRRQHRLPGSVRQHRGAAHRRGRGGRADGRGARPGVRTGLDLGARHGSEPKPRWPAPGGTVGDVSLTRRCSRTACGRPAVSTLTYVYADQTAVLGPLATYAEPHAYDLCEPHSERLSAPRGWDVLRLAPRPARATGPTTDDLLALADAVREAARPVAASRSAPRPTRPAARWPARGTCGCSPPTDATHRGRPAGAALESRRRDQPGSRDVVRAIFKAYDVRGTVPDQLDEELARRAGAAFVAGHRCRDHRSSSGTTCGRARPGFAARVRPRARRTRAPTWCTSGWRRPTSSTSPPATSATPARCSPPATTPRSTTGSRCAAPGARPIGMETGLAEIRDRGRSPASRRRRERPGHRHRAATCSTTYVDHLLTLAPVDGPSAARSSSTPATAWPGTPRRPSSTRLGSEQVEVVPMYFELDGTFPNHEANPIEPENLRDLQARVVERGRRHRPRLRRRRRPLLRRRRAAAARSRPRR